MRRLLTIFALLVAPMAFAQYARYDGSLQNAQGQAISGAQVYVLTQPANISVLTPQATVYADAVGTGGPQSQPLYTDGFGHVSFYTLPSSGCATPSAPGYLCYTVIYISPTTGELVYPDQAIGGGTGGGGGGGGGSGGPYAITFFTNAASATLPYSTYNFSSPGFFTSCNDLNGKMFYPNDTTVQTVGLNQYSVLFTFVPNASGSCTASDSSGGGGGKYVPITGGTVTGTLLAQNLNGIENEELYMGASVSARVLSAATACGTSTCIIQIPSYAPAGNGWGTLASNILLDDQRGINGIGIGYGGGFIYQRGIENYQYNAGDLDPYEATPAGASGKVIMSINGQASGGSNGNFANTGNFVGLQVFTNRLSSSTRSTWGIKTATACANVGTTYCTGYELDIGNNSGSPDPGLTFSGLNVIANGVSGGVGAGIVVQGSGGQFPFHYGLIISDYHNQGINLQTNDTSRTCDLCVTPPADDTSTTYRQTNHNGGNVTAYIDSLGNSGWTCVQVGGSIGPSWCAGPGSPPANCGTTYPRGSLFSSTTNPGTDQNFYVCEATGWVGK